MTVQLSDINDNEPVFAYSNYTFSLPEGQYSNHLVGTVSASDLDIEVNGKVTYSIAQGNDGEFGMLLLWW